MLHVDDLVENVHGTGRRAALAAACFGRIGSSRENYLDGVYSAIGVALKFGSSSSDADHGFAQTNSCWIVICYVAEANL